MGSVGTDSSGACLGLVIDQSGSDLATDASHESHSMAPVAHIFNGFDLFGWTLGLGAIRPMVEVGL